MCFTYQKKSIFSIPMAATPAADPMISKLPPVPAEKAMKCQIEASIPSWNIPIAAATKGTLSMTAEAKPKIITTILVLGTILLSVPAKWNKLPVDSNAATANRIPKKNNILECSIRPKALCTEKVGLASSLSSLLGLSNSEKNHTVAKENNIPK